jgi:hypothetical protein
MILSLGKTPSYWMPKLTFDEVIYYIPPTIISFSKTISFPYPIIQEIGWLPVGSILYNILDDNSLILQNLTNYNTSNNANCTTSISTTPDKNTNINVTITDKQKQQLETQVSYLV